MSLTTLNDQNFATFNNMSINNLMLLNMPEVIFTATAGEDSFNGATGNDTVDYSATDKGVVVSLDYSVPQNTQGSANDTLLNLENLTGTAYKDLLVGNARDNVIKGLAGDDTLVGGQGNDTLDGGDGIDTMDYVGNDKAVIVDLNYKVAQNTQGAGNDTILNIESLGGSNYDDLLVGSLGGGNKYIYGNGGNDVIVSGGQGLTTVLAGMGNDTVVSLDGTNKIDGGDGIDWVDYSHLSGGVVADLYNSTHTSTNDTRKNSDTLINIENLAGSNYDDVLKGNSQDNYINGNDGDDDIDGYYGNDIINGGRGNDLIAGSVGIDIIDGGEGIDTINYNYREGYSYQGAFSVTVNLGLTTAQAVTYNTTETLLNIENVIGTGGVDKITGNELDNNLKGLEGNDVLNGGDGNDTIDGGRGYDILDGGSGNDVLYGGDFKGTTSEGYYYFPGNDVLNGGEGNDNLDGGDGHDTLDGGSGNDIINGGEGIDWVAYSSASSGVVVNLNNQQAQNTLGSGIDTITNIENLSGSDYNDTLIGDNGNNILNGLQGDDILDGGAGIDEVYYINATQGVTVNLGNTNPQNTIGAGVDTLLNIENIQGSAFDDTLIGDSGSNLLSGNNGNDTLLGMAGDDVLIGGLGNNTLDGGEGFDTVDYSKIDKAITIDLNQTSVTAVGNDTLISIEKVMGTSRNDVMYGNEANNTFEGGDGDDVLAGGAGNDNLYGGNGYDTLDGGAGDDIIDGGLSTGANWGTDWASYGSATSGVTVDLNITTVQNTVGAGNDTLLNIENLSGSNYNDILTGNSDMNILNGGLGNDILTGGKGTDYFYMNSALGANNIDSITDFNPGDRDLLWLDASIFTQVTGSKGNYLNSMYFVANPTGVAMDSNDFITYNTTTGELAYDADANGAGASIVFTVLGESTHPSVSYWDIRIM